MSTKYMTDKAFNDMVDSMPAGNCKPYKDI